MYPPRSFGFAQVAQSVEQRTENPCVGGSIPSLGTIHKLSAVSSQLSARPLGLVALRAES